MFIILFFLKTPDTYPLVIFYNSFHHNDVRERGQTEGNRSVFGNLLGNYPYFPFLLPELIRLIDLHSILFLLLKSMGTNNQHSSKYFPLCSAEERNSYRFATT